MFPIVFVYEKIHAYPLIDKLYRNYHIYRNSSAPKRAAVCKIFTPVQGCSILWTRGAPQLASMNFPFLPLKFIIQTKLAPGAKILRSRRFCRHPYQWHRSTMAPMATMAISLIWPLWRYCHSGHSDIDDATVFLCSVFCVL